jgi:NADPH-dependent 2,4-dienoyl-CoA reductase/sulfur reductase-like enzyme
MELTTPNLNGVKSANKRRHVVIVGGGFGGLRAAQGLKSAPVDVTLIDRRNYHLFQPAPVIGYDKASKIAHYAMDNDLTLKTAALKLGFVTEEEFDRVVDPAKMVRPYVATAK